MSALPDDPDALFEQDAAALMALWLDASQANEPVAAAAQALCRRAQARGDVRSAQLSQALQALRAVSMHRMDPGTRPLAEQALQAARASGLARARRVAEVAWALFQIYEPEQTAAAVALLEAHGPVEADARPAAERFWTDAVLSSLYSMTGAHDEALARALAAEALAQASGLDLLRTQGGHTLAFTFLNVGDVEGALAVLPGAIASGRRCGRPLGTLHYNLLLALLLAGRAGDAAQVLEYNPDLLDPALLGRVPALRAAVALVRASTGRADEARALLEVPLAADVAEVHAMAANRLWMAGAAWLALGQPRQARELIEQGLAALQAKAAPLSPMNGTQLYRMLSEALEAQGDLRGSLAAIKRSQGFCFSWVGQSVRSRLQAMHREGSGGDPALHSARLSAVNRAVDGAAEDARAEAAQQAAARQSRFLAQVTHEMRNPLFGLIGMTSLLMMSDLDARQRQFLSRAQSSAQRLMALCNDVLDMAKIEAGKLELLRAPADVAQLARDTAQLLEPLVNAPAVTLECQVSPALPAELLCDRLRLQQLLMNLLAHALKRTLRGSVRLELDWQEPAQTGDPGELRVTVSDTGPGLLPESLARLFMEFGHDDAGNGAVQGITGLGLALARSLVQCMGGAIEADSAAGQGSVFRFGLPMLPADPDSPPVPGDPAAPGAAFSRPAAAWPGPADRPG